MKLFTTTEDRIIRMGEAWVVLGLPCRTGYDWIKKGILPKPIALGPRARGYRLSTLRAFLDSRGNAP
ncbi:MAG: AlpA family phage regulatory protein [Gammaproteobacteria bacterium]|nr:AlpA family phage regulatory protein [Gammaproteobacteria bacterium]MBU0785490.1 AlpA family phage regulatory protein [Gammaproteobacteria bacterium]MBU0813690.1 AlpA family phage regulatory protein [Gammaproteobacteria bacterium]MBU1788838.1 AlpA family phage regulatory protein [Gammaproteobacteria bacterium]